MTDLVMPDGIVGSEQQGVRVFCVAAPDPRQLASQIALVLGEHLAVDDKLHITHDAIQVGWRHDAGRSGWLGRDAHTEIQLEHFALVILQPQLGEDSSKR